MVSEQQLESPADMRHPRHVAIIMDGNGRWAKQLGKFRISGHKQGVKAVRRAVKYAVTQGIDALTLYAFSSENWSRPEQEVSALMDLFVLALDKEVKNLHKHNVRLRIIGDKTRFSHKLQERITKAEQITANNSGLTLNIAANYGGRWDIMQAVRILAQQVDQGELQVNAITEDRLANYISMHDLPAVDLVIRTGGEHRISNFLLWQIAYAEFYFTEVLWPDFDESIFQQAINAFAQRERRFGGTEPIAHKLS